MQVFKTKTGLINVLISLLIVVMVALMFVPSIDYAKKEDTYETSVYGYVFMLTEKPWRYMTDYIEDGLADDILGEGAGENYSVNDCFGEPMLILLLGVTFIVICFYGYKHWFPTITNVIWGIIGIVGATSNPIMKMSGLQTVYLILPIAVIVLALLNGALTTVLKKKEA